MFKRSIFFILLLVLLTNLATASTKEAAIQMTTTLENSQTDPAWNYAENIGDGRGITFGCIGFCTGTYDGNILIKYYTSLNPDNPLAKYIPALDMIDAGPHTAAGGDGNPSTVGLDGFIKDVHNCDDPLFKTAQLYQLDQLYWDPAQEQFKKLGYKHALTQALLYDASVRLGPYGMRSLVKKSTASDEIQFCKNFINEYTSVLKKEGLGDTSRMTGFTQVLNSGNYDLVTPYTFTAYGDKFTITGDLGLDNGDPEGTEVNEDNDTVPAPDLTIVEHSTAYDNRLRGSSPTTVLPSSNFIDVGGLGTGSYRDVMMFDLSGYKTTDTISKAILSLYWYYPAGTTRISDTVVEIYRPASQWDPKSVTWNSRAAGFPWSTAGGSWYDKNAAIQGSTPYASLTFPAKTVPDNRYYEFDVTQLVQEYVSGEYKNTGFFIKARAEGNNYIAFYSSDWSNSAQRPMLTVTSTSGSSQPTDNVQDSVPVANAGADQTVTVGSEVIFDGSASTDDNGIASYSWDFGDGTAGSGEVSPVHTYIAAGTYTVTLTVTDTAGQTATDTVTVVVSGTTTPTGPDTPTSGSVSYSATYDNRLREPSPTTVLPSSNFIDVGGLGTSSYRDVMMFDLSGYKTTDTISKATLSLYWYYPAGTTRTSDTVVEIYRPAVQWDPKSVTWNSRAAGFPWSTAGGSWYDKNAAAQGSTPYASLTFPAKTVPDNRYYEFDVTQLVQEYVSCKYEDTGFFIKARTEGNNYIAFYSSDWSNSAQRPKLTINE